jgi:hypothetical protein
MADPQSNQVGKGGVSRYAESLQRTLQKILTRIMAWNIVRLFSRSSIPNTRVSKLRFNVLRLTLHRLAVDIKQQLPGHIGF